MADCERYYSITTVWGYYYAVGIQYVGSSYALPTTMRALPTITLANASYTNSGSGSPGALSANSVNYNVTAATQGIVQYQADLHASAEL
jgi:hypothetical protein